MSSYSNIAAHQSMVFDKVRNTAYVAALDTHVKPDSVVLDLGSGLGIHGLIAAAIGARHVYLVDPSPVTDIASQVVVENGLADKVTCIQKTIEEAELPEKVDVIVSVFTGNFLLEEDLLPSLFYARDKYLKPSGVMVPNCGEMRVVPVMAENYYRKNVGRWSEPSQGVSFELVREKAANSLYFDLAKSRSAEFLAQPESLASIDFYSAVKADCSCEITFQVEKTAACHGFLGWFRMQLGQDWLSTSPLKPATHWSQVFLPLDPPLEVEKGKSLSLRLVRPQFGEWSWVCGYAGKKQQHSTFFSRLLSMEQLRTRSKEHKTVLSENGELVRFVIELLTGKNTNETILCMAAEKFGYRFSSPENLREHIQSIITAYGK